MSAGAQSVGTIGDMQARIDALEAQLSRLTASMSSTVAAGDTGSKIGRRGLLRRAAGATAAAALLVVAKEASTAEAASRTTIIGPSQPSYGIAAAPGLTDPEGTGFLPPLNPLAYGVVGSTTNNPVLPERSAGVLGLGSNTTGVQGLARSGYGVFGSTPEAGVGVFGGSGTGIGIYANSNNGIGLFSTSPTQALWGRTTVGLGVFGQATAIGGRGVYGAAPLAPNTFAGYFEGNVFVTGQVFTAGGGILSAQRQSDGSVRAFYSPDGTEPVIEAYGRGTLAGGRAEVALDPAVAAAGNGDYLVFLTEEGDAGGLYVATRGKDKFEVRARTGGAGSFAYRVVARTGAAGAAQDASKSATAKLEKRVDQAAPALPSGTTEPGAAPTAPEPRPRPAR